MGLPKRRFRVEFILQGKQIEEVFLVGAEVKGAERK